MARIGWTKCGTCGNTEAAVSETGTGTLNISCHKCQFSGYAKKGTKAERLIRAAMSPDEDAGAPAPAPAAPAPAPKAPKAAPVASPSPPPPRKPASSVFSLADL